MALAFSRGQMNGGRSFLKKKKKIQLLLGRLFLSSVLLMLTLWFVDITMRSTQKVNVKLILRICMMDCIYFIMKITRLKRISYEDKARDFNCSKSKALSFFS